MNPSDPARAVEQAEQVFSALAHPSRRQILLVLHFRGGKMTAGDTAERFACSWPTTTRPLNILRDAGLVSVTRRRRERTYVPERLRLRSVVGDWPAWFEEQPQEGRPVRSSR